MKIKDHGHEFAHLDALESIVTQAPPRRYLEVGVRFGDSLSLVIKTSGPALKHVTLCDSWGGEYGGESFGGHTHIDALLAKLEYKGRARYLDGNSHELLPELTRARHGVPLQADSSTGHAMACPYDLILVDGDHSEAGALADLRDCWAVLAPGGVLVFDDICHPAHPGLMGVLINFCRETGAEVVNVCTDKPMGCAVIQKT